MIRPITVVCWFLVLGSGLYLYRAKHDVELLDKRIQQIARETDTIRGESRRLLDEWIRLSEPEQLRKYTDQYLGLKTVTPTQFVRVVDLAARLPAPRALPPERLLVPVTAEEDTMDETEAEDLPTPPMPPSPVPPPMVAVGPTPREASREAPRESEVTRILAPRPISARTPEAKPTDPRGPGDPRMAEETRPIAPRPVARLPEPPRPAAEETRQASVRSAAPARASEPVHPVSVPALPVRPPEPARVTDDNHTFAPKPPAPRPTEPARTAANEQYRERETKPAPPAEPRPRPSDYTRQAASPPPAPSAVLPAPQTGSMLGMAARPRAPLPLPVPTPVSATWQGR